MTRGLRRFAIFSCLFVFFFLFVDAGRSGSRDDHKTNREVKFTGANIKFGLISVFLFSGSVPSVLLVLFFLFVSSLACR